MGTDARRKHEAALRHVAPAWRERHRREQRERRVSGQMTEEERGLIAALEAAGVEAEDLASSGPRRLRRRSTTSERSPSCSNGFRVFAIRF